MLHKFTGLDHRLRGRVELLTAILVVGCLLSACGSRGSEETEEAPTVTIGIQVSPAMALVMVAEERGFFREQGLNVELKEFTAGKFALQAFLGGSIDYAVSGEVPAVLAALQGNDVRVVAQVVERTVNEVRVIALADDSAGPKEYFMARKRKLSTSFGGGPEMFTFSFLKHFGIPADQVELISQKPEDMPAALEAKSVDAIAIFDPFAFIAEQRLGDEAVTFTAPDIYSELYVLVASPSQVDQHPERVESLLRALIQAADFVRSHEAEAKQITIDYTKLDSQIIEGIWSNFVFRPALTGRLMQYWKDETKWARETGKVDSGTADPNYDQMVAEQHLLKVQPDLVDESLR